MQDKLIYQLTDKLVSQLNGLPIYRLNQSIVNSNQYCVKKTMIPEVGADLVSALFYVEHNYLIQWGRGITNQILLNLFFKRSRGGFTRPYLQFSLITHYLLHITHCCVSIHYLAIYDIRYTIYDIRYTIYDFILQEQ